MGLPLKCLLLFVMTLMLQHLGWRPVYSMPAVKMKRTFVQTTKHTWPAVLMTTVTGLTKQDVSLNAAKIATGQDVLMNATISKHVVHVPQYRKTALLMSKWSQCVFATMVTL